MIESLTAFGPWLDRTAVRQLLEGAIVEDAFRSAVLAGALLRSRSTPVEIQRAVRAALPALFRGDEAYESLEQGIDMTLTDALDELAQAAAEGTRPSAERTYEVISLCNELQSVRMAIAAYRSEVIRQTAEDLPPRLAAIQEECVAATELLEERADEVMESLRAAVHDVEAPQELVDSLGTGEAVWWFDLVDPQWRALRAAWSKARRSPPQELPMAAAAHKPGDVLRDEHIEGGGRLRLRMDADGRLNAIVELPTDASDVRLCWLDSDGRRQTAVLGQVPGRRWRGVVAESALESAEIAIERDGALWVVDR